MLAKKTKSKYKWLEKIGFSLSFLCMIHCLTLPFIITFLPLLGISFLESHLFEWIVISISALIAFYTLIKDYQQIHGKIFSLALAVVGFVFIIMGHLILRLELPLSITGSLMLFSAYLVNWRLIQQTSSACKY